MGALAIQVLAVTRSVVNVPPGEDSAPSVEESEGQWHTHLLSTQWSSGAQTLQHREESLSVHTTFVCPVLRPSKVFALVIWRLVHVVVIR